MVESYLQLNSCDEQKYLVDILTDLKKKCNRASYADRRATALIESEDLEIEIELELAMEEITDTEKDLT
jgi:hypothetical protein